MTKAKALGTLPCFSRWSHYGLLPAPEHPHYLGWNACAFMKCLWNSLFTTTDVLLTHFSNLNPAITLRLLCLTHHTRAHIPQPQPSLWAACTCTCPGSLPHTTTKAATTFHIVLFIIVSLPCWPANKCVCHFCYPSTQGKGMLQKWFPNQWGSPNPVPFVSIFLMPRVAKSSRRWSS